MDEKQNFLKNFADMLYEGNKLLLEDDDDILLFNDISNSKNKKKTSGIKARLMKKCKNVSSNIIENDDLDKDDNVINNVELSLELEYEV